LQVISEWYNDHFYKLFPSEQDTIAQSRVRKNDILRMDEIKDPALNISGNLPGSPPVIAFQLAKYVEWDSTSYGRKEMNTTFPVLLTIPETASLFDLRVEVARRGGVPFHNVNVATATNYPILEGHITPIKEHTKNHSEMVSNTQDSEMDGSSEEDPDERAAKLAAQENRDSKTYNFKAEKRVQLKKLRLRSLEIVCWEDLRTKVDKPAQAPQVRNKKGKDSEGIKIKT